MERDEVKYLLDTAPWINAVTLPDALPPRIQRILESEEEKGLSCICLLEAAILHRLGRLALNAPLLEFFTAGLSADLRLLEITPAIAVATNDLPKNFQGDPFDRTIVATAYVMNLTLITADPAIKESGACRVMFYPFKPYRSKR